MEESIQWDDSNYKILDIIDMIVDNKEPQIPIKCPICSTSNAHIYMWRWKDNEDRGTIWTWCSNCRACSHASRVKLPDWWENADFIDVSELTSHPVFLEPKVDMIDEHLRQLLDKFRNIN